LIVTSFFPACVIDDTTPNAIPSHNYPSFEALFKDSLYQVENQTINAAESVDLNSTFNTNLKLTENSLLNSNGEVVSGAVEVQLIELLKKSDLIMSGLSMVRNNGTLLELAGGFSVTAWQNQEQLDFNGTIELDFDDPGVLSNQNGDLSVFYCATDSSPLEKAAADQSSVELVGDRYELTGRQIGWVLAAQDFVPTNGTTSLSLNSNLNETEVMDERAYVLFNDFTGVLSLPKNGSTFSTIGLPIGQSATIVMIAFDQQKFYIATEEITISENQSLGMVLQGYPVVDFVTLLKAID
jgi:hypothetical protein